MKKYFNRTTWPLWLAFWLPIIIMGSYFATRHMMPFGKSTILTVDLGQQYVDMFALLRNTLLHHPATFFYSFSNALGGDMLGVWTYYLMSPLNLILLFFPPAILPTGILFLTLLKYALASFTMTWVVNKLKWQTGWLATTFGIIYVLMGWMISYQLNLLWLDALILLPLIIYGLEKLLSTGKYRYYVIPFTLMLVINYYIAYMIALFLMLYWLWTISRESLNGRQIRQAFVRFVNGSLLSVALAAVVLLPTFFQLTQGKGQYNTTTIGNWIEYNPLFFFSKMFVGSFNFAQMPTGQPNIFIASIGAFGALLYFINRDFRWQNRLIASLITIFLFASMFIAPLDLLWHGLQFPVWYPYRFSFLWSFWLLWLAATSLSSHHPLQVKPFIALISTFAIIFIVVACTFSKTNFMTWPQLLVGSAFALLALVLLLMPRVKIWSWLILLLTITEVSTNAIWSLNNFSYLTKAEYQNEVNATHKALATIPNTNTQFMRIGQTYSRTKDDPFMQDYFGGSAFSSSFSKKTSDFMGLIGNPNGDNYATYYNGTMLTDNLLGFKYFLDASTHFATAQGAPAQMQNTQRPDLLSDLFHAETPDVTIYKNPNALGLGFAANSAALKTQLKNSNPLVNQTNLWDGIVGQSNQALFTALPFLNFTTQNANRPQSVNGAFLTPKNLVKPTSLTATFIPQDNNPYYLTIGPNMTPDVVTITLNGRVLHTNDAFKAPIILNVANLAKDQPQTLVFTLKKANLWLQNVGLYELNAPLLTAQTKQLQAHSWQINHFSQRKISGDIDVPRTAQLLMTTIPQIPGWHALVDGQPVATKTVANMFLAVPLKPGQHTVTLKYTPPFLILGSLISLLAVLITLVYTFLQRKR
ncbi:YfhO family protein [Periweissella ghanensis]|uniref:YfhO family protein n=1 Tax=Periweissella ghanensis TaxID=467997 RepID=A0ABM8ZEM7_9LACO|nr:YfhO family protein [Periweissella ghanensis]MCM0600279.1 YfhO family protein [Periweissella ghanensis]CAH0419145.1 hypothetical protein WGH24286_01592 [Periweissella ghanensis]